MIICVYEMCVYVCVYEKYDICACVSDMCICVHEMSPFVCIRNVCIYMGMCVRYVRICVHEMCVYIYIYIYV